MIVKRDIKITAGCVLIAYEYRIGRIGDVGDDDSVVMIGDIGIVAPDFDVIG